MKLLINLFSIFIIAKCRDDFKANYKVIENFVQFNDVSFENYKYIVKNLKYKEASSDYDNFTEFESNKLVSLKQCTTYLIEVDYVWRWSSWSKKSLSLEVKTSYRQGNLC